MTRMCRNPAAASFRNRQSALILRHARIITDPKRLRELYEKAARQKRASDSDRKSRF
jgi:hypothetical protein